MDAHEADRRASFAHAIEAYFREHLNEWIPASTLMLIGGRMAWRTRVSDARKQFKAEGGRIENRQTRIAAGLVLSEYRYTDYQPLGRDSTVYNATQKSLW